MTITVFAIFKVTNTLSSFAYISVWFLVVLSLVAKPDAQLRHLAAVTEDSPRTLLRFKGKIDVFFHLLAPTGFKKNSRNLRERQSAFEVLPVIVFSSSDLSRSFARYNVNCHCWRWGHWDQYSILPLSIQDLQRRDTPA